VLVSIRGVVGFILICQIFIVQAKSYSVEHFRNIGNDINRDPRPVYLQLLDIEKSKKYLNEESYLWLLYRKANAENLLYLHDEFAATVAHAQSLITPNSSAEIQAALDAYAGLVAERNGKFEQAIKLYRKAMARAAQENLNYIYTQSKHYLAYTLSLTELYETSLADLQEAYVEAFALEDHFLIAVINETYGAVYGYMNEYHKSIEHYNLALDTYERLGYKPYIAEAIYGLASTYRYMKKYELAISKFELYLERIGFSANQSASYFGAYGLGMTYAEQGSCNKAIEIIDKALLLKGQLDYDAELYKKRAYCQISFGLLDQAKQSIEKADTIFKSMPELKETTWSLETVKLKAELAFAHNQFKDGYLLLLNYYERYSNLLIKNSSQQLIKVRAAMELERQNIQVSLLQQRNKLQQLQISAQEKENRQQLYFIIGSIVVCLLLLVIAFMQHWNRKKLLALSITDPLTGLNNRRYVFQCMERLIANSQSRQSDLSILLFDVDDFKKINDKYGHAFGDEVLCRIAQVTTETLRVGDILGRIGGEEFLCVLPRTDTEQAIEVAGRIKNNIRDTLFINDEQEQVTITVSIGISALDETQQDRATLYVQSDKALYQAKHQGKDQIVSYISQ